MKVYLSSTFLDLKRHRSVVGRALRKAQYDVVMMEEYVARDERVEFACQGDVLGCDVYVGIFAWRYGYVPEENNPERLSVTELEYTAAKAKRIPSLTFLLDEKARWPKAAKDPDTTRIGTLRARLKERCSAYFATTDQLAMEVLAALRVHESTHFAKQLEAIEIIHQGGEAYKLGPSYLLNIKEKLAKLQDVLLVEVQLGPTPWWNTRLHLVAALAQEFARVREFVFVDADRRFVVMASPAEIRRRLGLRWPELERAYVSFRRGADTVDAIERDLWSYPQLLAETFGSMEETAKHVLTVQDLQYELGIARDAEVVNMEGKGQRFLLQEILGRETQYVAMVREKKLEGTVDRQELAQKVSTTILRYDFTGS